MKIALASDHAGFELKEFILQYLKNIETKTTDFGCYNTDPVDYPDTAIPASESVAKGENDYGILICGSGLGMSMIANKVKGIRASLCQSVEFAKLTRAHNDANVLVLAGRFTEPNLAVEIVTMFLHEPFSGEQRHLQRIQKVMSYER